MREITNKTNFKSYIDKIIKFIEYLVLSS